MNAHVTLPESPIGLMRLDLHPNDEGVATLLVLVMAPDRDAMAAPGRFQPAPLDLEEEPTWEDAECL